MVLLLPNLTLTYWYKRFLLIGLLWIIWIGQTPRAHGQGLVTGPLAVSTVCPGAQIDVVGDRGSGAESYVIELSDGGTIYTEIPSLYLTSSGRYSITYRATIPANTPAGTNYRIRISSRNPLVSGTPSSTTLTVLLAPSAPTVASVSYCQGTSPGSLTALGLSGGTLAWYTTATGGTASTVAPAPSATSAGTADYYVSQTVGSGCESQRADLKVTIKPTPNAPTTGALSICQNTAPQSLSATGQNLLWYTSTTGGNGTTITPVISTSQAGQTNYYVSQSVDGCESARSTLALTVKPQPAAPGVTAKTLCQFAPAELVTATGEGLAWYNADGTPLGTAPSINTDKGASYSVLVTQTVGGCESPKATLAVAVIATPAPTVSKVSYEFCQGTAATMLNASGSNLKWTDPSGNVTTTAPTPSTTKASTKSEGDTYYVTQTVNGCESPKVAISVLVQMLPTLSIVGTNTVNLGVEVPLKLMFTGVGPYQYKLSNGLSGTATKDTTLIVLPTQTTTYQVTEVTNKCGAGTPGTGSAAYITVLTPTIETLPLTSATVCAGTNLTTAFLTTGSFNTGSVFKVQLARMDTDPTKLTFTDLATTQINSGQLAGTIPGNTASGTYQVRVIATNPKIPILGSVSSTSLTVRALPAATLVGTQTILEGQPASLSVVFSGDGPWMFSYRDSTSISLGAIQSMTATASPQIFTVNPKKTTAYYLTSVSNACGTGSLAARTVVVTVNPLLGIEDTSLAEAIEVYPIPATTTLTVRIQGLSPAQPALIELTDLRGHITSQQQTQQSTSTLAFDSQPAGVYILRVRVGERVAAKRIVKL